MSTKVDVNNLADAIGKVLQDYSKETVETVKQCVKEAGDFCKNQIQTNARSKFDGTGQYADSWVSEKADESIYNVTYVVHSTAPYYRLSHLLEYGHEKWLSSGRGKGTRYYGRVQGRPHIRPAEKAMIKQYTESIAARVKVKK